MSFKEDESMKNFILFFIISALISHFSAICSYAEDTTISLKDAFDAGSVSITFSAKASGEMLQVEVKKELPGSLIAKVDKGTTVFDFFGDKMSILTDSVIMVDLTEKEEGSFIVQQSGSSRITSGGVTWKKIPPQK